MTKLSFLSVAALSTAIFMAACENTNAQSTNSDENAASSEETPITRTGSLEQNWTIGGKSLSFGDGRYSGFTGCNNFSGTYELIGTDRVRIDPMVMTRKACIGPDATDKMSDEANFGQNLPGEYNIRYEGTTVILLNDERSWVFANAGSGSSE